MTRLGVLVSGNGSNLQALIDATKSGVIPGEIAVVISNKPNVRALERAKTAGIENLVLSHKSHDSREAYDGALVELLRARNVQWVVLAGFMRLISNVLLEAYEHRIVNIHPSLLPAFPGLDAGKQAFEHGCKVTGCTVHFVTQVMDSGPIIAQTPVEILDDDSLDSLMTRIHAAEHATLVQAVRALCEGRVELLPAPQGGRSRVRVRPTLTQQAAQQLRTQPGKQAGQR